MKILMVSIFAPHFFNWTEQLRDSGHEVYWLDVFDSNTHVEKIDFAQQIIGWRYKKNFKGRYFIKNRAPKLNRIVNLLNERKLTDVLESKIKEIRPDVIHSFVIYLSGVPILPVIEKFPEVKWILSTWGSDLYYYREQPKYLEGIKKVLPKIDYLFTDCKRDQEIARENGFQGKFMGVFPGGGGFELEKLAESSKPHEERNIILIKGYQGKHGKCVEVLKAVSGLREEFTNYEIVVFGAAEEVFEFIDSSDLKHWNNLKCLEKLARQEVLELMGRSLLYIGNSSSDGMPNTLLEAIVMGAFPIQSNPGGATAELIEDGKNGVLIEDPTDVQELKNILKEAINGSQDLKAGVAYNFEYIRPMLDRGRVREQVLEKYKLIESEI
ncbi:glycosyltransferase family 4 protein [Salinimicrobium gaetbulicola]|uniref:Glycosyltransferase family 4 protein n=1 Tax=Salinimicrobium gaetbulicola TaxID=999702 RepID=A0ABW3IIP5_9FLAO